MAAKKSGTKRTMKKAGASGGGGQTNGIHISRQQQRKLISTIDKVEKNLNDLLTLRSELNTGQSTPQKTAAKRRRGTTARTRSPQSQQQRTATAA